MMDFKSMLDGLAKKGINIDDDFESQPQPLDGQYIGEVTKVAVFDKDNGGKTLSFSIQITQTISGDKGERRYLNKKYNVGEVVWADRTISAEDSMEELLKGLLAIGIYNTQMTFKSEADLIEHIKTNAIGKSVNLRTWPQKDKVTKEVKRDTKGWPKQSVKFVKEFKLTAAKEDSSTESIF